MYKTTPTGGLMLEGMHIPLDESNAFYMRYLNWLEEGNVLPPPTEEDVEVAKAEVWERIKAYRDRVSDGGYSVPVAGSPKWFHSDAKSRTQQIGLVLAGAAIPPVPWKTMDGTFVTMSQGLAVAIFQAAMQKESLVFAVAEAHRAAMEASADPLSYDFTTGWPKGYGE
jgi:hypothetical protein